VLKLLSQLLVFNLVLLGLLNTNTVVLSYCVELRETGSEFLQLLDLLVSQLFGFLVILLKLLQLFCEVDQPLGSVLYLL